MDASKDLEDKWLSFTPYTAVSVRFQLPSIERIILGSLVWSPCPHERLPNSQADVQHLLLTVITASQN